MHTAIPLTVLATALVCSLPTTPANARARVFVASYGNDANPCTFGSPCKTFQQAVNVVDPGGEVTAIDSAGFGPITITQAVTITSPDGVEAGIVPAAGGNAITINAGPTDAVVLRGLTLNGSGIALNGVVFDSGASLTVTNCVVQNFIHDLISPRSGNGILIQPTSGTVKFEITSTIVSNNGSNGIYYFPGSSAGASGVVDHVTATNNSNGVEFLTVNTPYGTTIVVSNSVASNNSSTGVFISGGGAGPLLVAIDNTEINNNGTGIFAESAAVELGRSVLIFNGTPIQDNTAGNFFSFKNNQIGTTVSALSPLGLQ